jgi:hypothetical protein
MRVLVVSCKFHDLPYPPAVTTCLRIYKISVTFRTRMIDITRKVSHVPVLLAFGNAPDCIHGLP